MRLTHLSFVFLQFVLCHCRQLTSGFKRAVIIGAGPTGLASAIMLRTRGWNEIILLERRSAESVEKQKAYLYLIDGRGQMCTNMLNITSEIVKRSVSGKGGFRHLDEVLPSGEVKSKTIPSMSPGELDKYFLPRKALLDILTEEITSPSSTNYISNSSIINLHFNSSFDSINVENDSATVCATLSDGHQQTFAADLILGCDGLNSPVRSWLDTYCKSLDPRDTRFTPVQLPSDAAGLRYKILCVEDNFPFPLHPVSNPNPEALRKSNKSVLTAIRSNNKAFNTRMSLGLLPVTENESRTANIITRPDHRVWGMRTGADLAHFLQDAFPALDWDRFAPQDELDRLAAASPGMFPKPQYSNGMYRAFGRTAVILAGDSVHAFPPDLGQGVNSGLVDVVALREALDESGDDPVTAGHIFEQKRLPEAKAICRLQQFAYPLQYNQKPQKKKLFVLNLILRMSLSKIAPFLFSPSASMMVQDHSISYSEILKRSHQTTNNIIMSTGIISATVTYLRNRILRRAFLVGVLASVLCWLLSRLGQPSREDLTEMPLAV